MSTRTDRFVEQAERHFADPSLAGKLFVPDFAPNALPDSNIGFEHVSIEEAFPAVDPGLKPLGNLVLVQFRQPLLRSHGGLELVGDTHRKTELDNTQVAKVIDIGPLAFRNRDTGQLWPEGAWCAVGDYIRVPKFQGDYFQIDYIREDRTEDQRTGKLVTHKVGDRVMFAQFKDLALLGRYPTAEHALRARAFL